MSKVRVRNLIGVTINITEWLDEPNPKLRFSASIDFEFPVPLEYGIVGSAGATGNTPATASRKLIGSATVQKYLNMKSDQERREERE